MNRHRYTNRRHQMPRLTLWDAVAVAAMVPALWYILFAIVGALFELNHYLTNQ